MKQLRAAKGVVSGLLLAAAAVQAATVFADADPYADYVKLSKPGDSWNNPSWNVAGRWSDGAIPDPTKNYYVPSGLYCVRTANAIENDVWAGGQLVIAGKLRIYVSQGDIYAPMIRDLVLLGGGELLVDCYGPLREVNGEVGVVTVKGTHANPSLMTHHYSSSFTSGGSARTHSMKAKLAGTSDSCLVFTRPMKNASGVATDRGFYMNCANAYYGEYPGTFVVRGTNTIVKCAESETFNWPLAAVEVEDGADLYFYYNNTFSTATTNAFLRSLKTAGGNLFFNYNTATARIYPILNLSERLDLGSDTKLALNSTTPAPFVGGVSATNPDGLSKRIFHLTGEAAETVGDLSNVTLQRVDGGFMPTNIVLKAVANGDGSKDIYLATPGIVAMTNNNVETSGYPAGSIQYGAFEPGHAGDWSNGETPTADSELHYMSTARLCFFQPVNLPKATLTIAFNSSWKAGASLTFKEVNMYEGLSFGLWASDNTRTLNAERFNVHSGSGSAVLIQLGQSKALTINAELCGDGNLTLRNMNDQIGHASLNHANTNYHGRLTLSQQALDGVFTPGRFTTYLGDARNWGGQYTKSDDIHNAITLSNFMKATVTNSVDFTEPTRGMLIQGGATFDVQAGRTMRLSNQVTYAGVLVKAGAGTLELAGTARFIDGAAGTAPLAGTNALNVTAGALKVSSAEAAEGLAVTFAEGTKLVVPAGASGYRNVTWDAPLTVNTASDTLPVEIELDGSEVGGNIEVTICTFNATAAQNIQETAFAVANPSRTMRCKKVEKRTGEDGNVSYVATVGPVGARFIVQ